MPRPGRAPAVDCIGRAGAPRIDRNRTGRERDGPCSKPAVCGGAEEKKGIPFFSRTLAYIDLVDPGMTNMK